MLISISCSHTLQSIQDMMKLPPTHITGIAAVSISGRLPLENWWKMYSESQKTSALCY